MKWIRGVHFSPQVLVFNGVTVFILSNCSKSPTNNPSEVDFYLIVGCRITLNPICEHLFLEKITI